MSIPTTVWKKRQRFREDEIVGNETALPTFVGKLATDLARQIAICLGDQDGEDSSGRAKLKLMSPEKIAKHACDVAQCMAEEFDRRGWFVDVPVLPDEPEKKAEDTKPEPGHPRGDN